MQLSKTTRIAVLAPSAPTPTEGFAAGQLKKYLSLMLGTCCFTDSAEDADAVFLIGGPERNALVAPYLSEAEFKKTVPGPEGMLIKALDERTLLIAGSSWHTGECERGTLYAVYELLERFCGCTLAAFSHPDADAGEIVPHHDELTLESVHYCKERADLPYRTAIIQYSDAAGDPDHLLNEQLFDWLAKNRYNRVLTWTSVYDYFKRTGFLDEIAARGIRFTVGHHESSRLFLPAFGNEYFAEHYLETHPEYFKKLPDGTRFNNQDHWGQWVYCTRNKEVVDVVAQNVIAWLSQNPTVDVLALWPNDGIADQCCCEECQKYTKTENYAYFINAVAERVTKVHPHIRFDMLIYVDLWRCPDGFKLHPSVLVDEATWPKEGLRTVGKPDGSCLNDTTYEENLLRWKAAGAEVVYYDYYMGVYGMRQRWMPAADEIQAIWKNFIKKGISGAGTQLECFNHWNHLLNFYSFGRTGYDTSRTLQDNIHALCRLFGSAAPEVEKILQMGEDCLDGQVEIHKCGHYVAEHIDKEAIYAAYERAFALAETPRHRNNLRLMRMVFRYSDLETADPMSKEKKHTKAREGYADENGELAKMTEFDSLWKNNPGYGIGIPVKSEKPYTGKDKWYEFE